MSLVKRRYGRVTAPVRSISLDGRRTVDDDDFDEDEAEEFSSEHKSLRTDSGRVVLMGDHDHCGHIDCLTKLELLNDTLTLKAAQAVARLINSLISSADGVMIAYAYISELQQCPLTLVVGMLGALRPRFLPLEYHWAPTETDPFLSFVEHLPQLQDFFYVAHPLSNCLIERILCAHSGLGALSVVEGADDALLRVVGTVCPNLHYIDVKKSKGVTDCGLRRLLLKPPAASRFHWRQLYRRWRELRTSMYSSGHAVAAYRPLYLPTPSSPSMETPTQRTPLSSTLFHLDLRGTRVSRAGADWSARRLQVGSHVLLTPFMTRVHRRLRSTGEEINRSLVLDM